jgi:hypothetical protein
VALPFAAAPLVVPAKRETGLRPDGDVGNTVLSEISVLSEPVAKRDCDGIDNHVLQQPLRDPPHLTPDP